MLLAPLSRAPGVHHHGPRGLALEGDATLGHFRDGPRTVPRRLRLREHTDLLPLVTSDHLLKDPSTCALGGGEAGDEPSVPQGREMVLRHQSRIGNRDRGPRLHPRVRSELGEL